MTHATPLLRHIAMGAVLGFLAGCMSPTVHPPPKALSETPREPTVSLVKLTDSVRFAPGRIEPSPVQLGGMRQFLADSEVRRGDVVYVLHGPAPLDLDRAQSLSSVLLNGGYAAVVQGDDTIPLGEVRVIVERYVATGPRCPDWSQPDADRVTNELPSNFGCADAANLAAMVANPHDLVSGRTMGPAVGQPTSRPVQLYRAGTLPPLLAGGGTGGSGSAAGGGGASGP